MKFVPASKGVIAIAPAVVNGASFTAVVIDTKQYAGFDYASFFFQLGVTDVALSALKLQESDTSGSGYSDISGADFSAHLPTATDDNKIWQWNVMLGGTRKRYIKVIATAASGSTGAAASCLAVLTNATEAPFDATTSGAAYLLEVA